jgi:hypothetical protein
MPRRRVTEDTDQLRALSGSACSDAESVAERNKREPLSFSSRFIAYRLSDGAYPRLIPTSSPALQDSIPRDPEGSSRP